MVEVNKILKLLFICASLVLLIILVISPKTDCQACSLRDGNKLYDGYQAFELYEDACISYNKPWDPESIFNFTNVTVMEGYPQ